MDHFQSIALVIYLTTTISFILEIEIVLRKFPISLFSLSPLKVHSSFKVQYNCHPLSEKSDKGGLMFQPNTSYCLQTVVNRNQLEFLKYSSIIFYTG